jgi:hypothetical protein
MTTPTTSRRAFLKTAGTTAGALMAGPARRLGRQRLR